MNKTEQNYKVHYLFENNEYSTDFQSMVPVENTQTKVFNLEDEKVEFLLFNEASVVINEHKKKIGQIGTSKIIKIKIV